MKNYFWRVSPQIWKAYDDSVNDCYKINFWKFVFLPFFLSFPQVLIWLSQIFCHFYFDLKLAQYSWLLNATLDYLQAEQSSKHRWITEKLLSVWRSRQKTDQLDSFRDVLVVLQILNLATLRSVSPIKLTHFTLGCFDWLLIFSAQ
jgi:hypothetical protein